MAILFSIIQDNKLFKVGLLVDKVVHSIILNHRGNHNLNLSLSHSSKLRLSNQLLATDLNSEIHSWLCKVSHKNKYYLFEFRLLNIVYIVTSDKIAITKLTTSDSIATTKSTTSDKTATTKLVTCNEVAYDVASTYGLTIIGCILAIDTYEEDHIQKRSSPCRS